MAYKFGEKKDKIVIGVEDKEYYIQFNDETIKNMEDFSKKAEEISKEKKDINFVEAEEVALDFIEAMLGQFALDEILDLMPEDSKNLFEYMGLAMYIIEQVNEQAEKMVEDKPTRQRRR